MNEDKRDALWELSFETYYDAFFEEMAAESLVQEWVLADEVTRVLVACTASGSAIAGWALWNHQPFRYVWAAIAGVAALLAIVHSSLAIASRIKQWAEVKDNFAALRIDLDTFRGQLAVDPDFPLEERNTLFLKHRERFKDYSCKLRNDILRTTRFEIKIQDRLNEKIRDKILS